MVEHQGKMSLRQWMAFRGYDGRRLAREIGVSETTVHNWRVGKTLPSGRFIPILERILAVNFGDIDWADKA